MGIQNPHNRKGKRVDKDAYETPTWVTEALFKFIKPPLGSRILEPACGTGLMVRALRKLGFKNIIGRDIAAHKNQDFLLYKGKADHVITNPPYKDELPERFARHALDNIVPKGGFVALLVTTHFLGSAGRYEFFNETHKPFVIIYLSDRIRFLVNGEPISGQAYDHCWVVWKKGFKGETVNYWYCKEDKAPRRKLWRV